MYYTLFPIIRKFRFKIDFLFLPSFAATATTKNPLLKRKFMLEVVQYIIFKAYIHELRG